MVFISSRDRQKDIKKLYKIYGDLPNGIIRQIIQHKLYADNNMKLDKAISCVRSINNDILKIQTAVNEKNLIDKALSKDTYILMDNTNRYSEFMNISDVSKKLSFLRQTKREIIMDMKYQYYIKKADKFLNM